MQATPPDALPYTGDPAADALLAAEPMALLIGFVLDQQVSVQKAFSGPLELQNRIGTLDAATIAAMDPVDLEAAFRERPALHRFPGNMAARVKDLAAYVRDTYDGHAERIWTEATDSDDLARRIQDLPGFGKLKVKGFGAVLAKHFGVAAAQGLVPWHPTLGDVDSPEALARYQAAKKIHKKEWDRATT